MKHALTHQAAACAAAFVLALLQVACSEGLDADTANHLAPAATAAVVAQTGGAFGGVEYLPGTYPAPQGEAQELPAQF